MFSAFTGTPGAGKTINALEYVDTDPQYKGREVFYYGINECRMDNWTELSLEQLYDWYNFIPDGSVLFVDEAQEHWRAGTPTAKIPLHLTKLERHRHKGIDIVITCQSMAQLHRMAKVLIDHHRHYLRPHGAESYQCLQYTECKENPTSQVHVKTAIKSKGKYNKDYYDKYTSAQLHTYRDRFPKKYKVMLWGCFLLTPLIIFAVFSYIKSMGKVDGSESDQPVAESVNLGSTPSVFDSSNKIVSRADEPLTLAKLLELTTPLVENDPKTAPLYMAQFGEAKDYPREQCVIMHEGPRAGLCRCYTQQGTRMRNVNAQTCKLIIYEGREFDYRIEPTRGNENVHASKEATTVERAQFSYPMELPKERQKIRPVVYPDKVQHPRNRFRNG